VLDAILDPSFAVLHEAECPIPLNEIRLRAEHDRRPRQLDRAAHQRTRVAASAGSGVRRDTSDAMTAACLLQEPQRAHDHAVRALDPEMPGLGIGVARVDVRIHAVLLHDEDVLPHGEDAEQRARGQLVEAGCVNVRELAVAQLVACGSTAAVQNEQRFAALGMMLRHSGHARVFDSPGSVGLASRCCMRWYGMTKKK